MPGSATKNGFSTAILSGSHWRSLPKKTKGEVAVVILLFGPHVVVDKRCIAARVLTDTANVDHVARTIPVRQVVTARFPWMGDRNDPGSLGVARAVPPFVPCIDAIDESGRLLGFSLGERPDD